MPLGGYSYDSSGRYFDNSGNLMGRNMTSAYSVDFEEEEMRKRMFEEQLRQERMKTEGLGNANQITMQESQYKINAPYQQKYGRTAQDMADRDSLNSMTNEIAALSRFADDRGRMPDWATQRMQFLQPHIDRSRGTGYNIGQPQQAQQPQSQYQTGLFDWLTGNFGPSTAQQQPNNGGMQFSFAGEQMQPVPPTSSGITFSNSNRATRSAGATTPVAPDVQAMNAPTQASNGKIKVRINGQIVEMTPEEVNKLRASRQAAQ
jgi:hypothetical protein